MPLTLLRSRRMGRLAKTGFPKVKDSQAKLRSPGTHQTKALNSEAPFLANRAVVPGRGQFGLIGYEDSM